LREFVTDSVKNYFSLGSTTSESTAFEQYTVEDTVEMDIFYLLNSKPSEAGHTYNLTKDSFYPFSLPNY
jgi:hypothetical protein